VSDPLQATFRIAASGLAAQSARMRVSSENLANAQSTGSTPGSDPYVRKTISFETEFDERMGVDIVKVESIGTNNSPFRVEYDPGHPAADEKGYVKRPNVNPLIELADMREANRSYMANLQMIRQARDAVNMTLDLLRTN
jgi:flagellar basal-body rod protein FlgC